MCIIDLIKDNANLIIGIVVSGFISWIVTRYYYKKGRYSEEEIARYVVFARLLQHPVKDAEELKERVAKYRNALNRTKKDKRGVPVYRDDGSIGINWDISIEDKVDFSDKATLTK